MDRRLSVILSSDVVGFSKAMGSDEAGTLATLKRHRRNVIEPKTRKYGGRVIKLMGDGALMEFSSVVDATAFAVEMQCAISDFNDTQPEERRLLHRIGINLGDVILEKDDIYGDGVNIAARLQALADPGGICISRAVRTQVQGKLDLSFEDMGRQSVKNIEKPIPAYKVILDERAAALLLRPSDAPPKHGSHRAWVTAAAVVLLLAAIAVNWLPKRPPEFEPVNAATMVHPLPAQPSIAVLALDDHSTGDENGYLSDAIAEGVIAELSRFSEFHVIARNSSFKYRDKPEDVREIAKELGVHYVLEGSQQKSGDKLRVTVQLIDALAGNHIWAQTYERDLADLFVVQDEIVRAVASAVGGKVAFRPPPSGGLASVSALYLNLQGRPFVRQWDKEGTSKALELNLQAVEADPASAFGYIGLAFIYPRAEYGWLGMSGEEGLALAEEAADKAIALDPDNYDAHYARAFVHERAGEQSRAIQRYERALELNPNAANVMAALSTSLVYTGRVDEAHELLIRAMRLDPHHPDWFKWNLAWAYWAKGECEAALQTMNAMSNMPNRARQMLAVIHVCLGQQQEAEAVVQEFLEKEPDASLSGVRALNEKRYSELSLLENYLAALKEAGFPD